MAVAVRGILGDAGWPQHSLADEGPRINQNLVVQALYIIYNCQPIYLYITCLQLRQELSQALWTYSDILQLTRGKTRRLLTT